MAKEFRDLHKSGRYEGRSPKDFDYNCIAYAAGDVGHWWWPSSGPVDWWPSGLERHETLTAFDEMFQRIGYEPASNASHETGYVKTALYALGTTPKHAARQEVGTGNWLSKLGNGYDIMHPDLEDLEDSQYGVVVATYRRPLDHGHSFEIQLVCESRHFVRSETVRLDG